MYLYHRGRNHSQSLGVQFNFHRHINKDSVFLADILACFPCTFTQMQRMWDTYTYIYTRGAKVICHTYGYYPQATGYAHLHIPTLRVKTYVTPTVDTFTHTPGRNTKHTHTQGVKTYATPTVDTHPTPLVAIHTIPTLRVKTCATSTVDTHPTPLVAIQKHTHTRGQDRCRKLSGLRRPSAAAWCGRTSPGGHTRGTSL